MKHWIRVTLISSVLIGGTVFFAYQSLSQFNKAFDNLSASYIAIANTRLISFSDKTNGEHISTTTQGIVLTSTSTLTLTLISTSTPTSATSTDLKLSFLFPKKDSEVYVGCTYRLPLQSSTTIRSLQTALIDAGTRETIGPIASGLARENTIEPASQSLDWKVGVVWPGDYYIKVSKVNGIDLENKSKVFTINKMPEGITAAEREKNCKEANISV